MAFSRDAAALDRIVFEVEMGTKQVIKKSAGSGAGRTLCVRRHLLSRGKDLSTSRFGIAGGGRKGCETSTRMRTSRSGHDTSVCFQHKSAEYAIGKQSAPKI